MWVNVRECKNVRDNSTLYIQTESGPSPPGEQRRAKKNGARTRLWEIQQHVQVKRQTTVSVEVKTKIISSNILAKIA